MKRVRQGEVGEEGDLGAARDNVLCSSSQEDRSSALFNELRGYAP